MGMIRMNVTDFKGFIKEIGEKRLAKKYKICIMSRDINKGDDKNIVKLEDIIPAPHVAKRYIDEKEDANQRYRKQLMGASNIEQLITVVSFVALNKGNIILLYGNYDIETAYMKDLSKFISDFFKLKVHTYKKWKKGVDIEEVTNAKEVLETIKKYREYVKTLEKESGVKISRKENIDTTIEKKIKKKKKKKKKEKKNKKRYEFILPEDFDFDPDEIPF